MRNLDREIANICRKIASCRGYEAVFSKRVTEESLAQIPRPSHVYSESRIQDSDEVGLATGVAWTENGGDVMEVEITLMPGKGGMTLTGQLGDVLQKSVQAALSLIARRRKHSA